MRLEEITRTAKEKGYKYFTTTLLVSPYQNHELLKDIAKEMQDKYGIEFVYYDFREGFREGQSKAKEMGIYRQKYCGCLPSKRYM